MLHEIFKGMDNAAEKINENFQEIGLPELDYPSTTRGYVKFPNGLIQAWGLTDGAESLTAGQSKTITWDLPTAFSIDPIPQVTLISASNTVEYTAERGRTQIKVNVRNTGSSTIYVQAYIFVVGR